MEFNHNRQPFTTQFHRLYEDWTQVMVREGEALAALLRPRQVSRVLDSVCGTGAWSLGLAQQGFWVTARDPNPAAVSEAQRRATELGVETLETGVASLMDVAATIHGSFEAVLNLGSSYATLPLLERVALLETWQQILVPGGMVLIGMHDWDWLLQERPQFIPRRITKPNGHRLVMFDVWDYHQEDEVVLTTFHLHDEFGHWTVDTKSVVYHPVRAGAFLEEARLAGYRVVEQIQRARENWWLLVAPGG